MHRFALQFDSISVVHQLVKDQSLGCPLSVFGVTLGHVFGLGGVAAFVWRAQMAGHTLVGMEALDGLRSQSYFELVLH